MPETWWAYVTRNAPGRSRADIGGLAGVDPSQVSRWKSGATPRPENAIGFARSIGGDPVEALVVAGFLSPGEACAATVIRTGGADLSDEELLAEIRVRFVRGMNTGCYQAGRPRCSDGVQDRQPCRPGQESPS